MKETKRTMLIAFALVPAMSVAAVAGTLSEPPAQGQEARKEPGKKAARNKPLEATVVVTGRKGPDEVYRVEAINAPGPLGMAKIADIPNSIQILPATLLENVQATSIKEALKYAPLTQFQEQQGPEILRPATRGMQGSNYQNTRLDGMTIFVTGANALEQLQQIEVFSGLPASVFGPANPAGMFNFVTKRPTPETQLRANLGYDASSIYTAHVDLGGKLLGSDVFSYRLNVLDSHGTSYVSGSRVDRKLATLAFDVRPSRDTTLEFNLSNYDLDQKGLPGWFTYGETIALPAAPDPTRVGYGQSYSGVAMTNQTLHGRLLQNLGSNWILVVGGLVQSVDRNINTAVNNITNNSGAYTSSLGNGFAPHFGIASDIAYLTGSFKTGEITHDLTVGTTGSRAFNKAVLFAPTAANTLLGSASLANPVVFARPAAGMPDVLDQYQSSVVIQQGFNISDTMAFSRQWSLKLALSQDWMQTQNYSKAGVKTTSYNRNGLSPMPSLIFKPRPDVTTYVTYASSLQQGEIAPSGSLNQNTSLAPFRSTQWEAGVKVARPNIDYCFAVFRLERPFARLDTDKVYKTMGQQVNNGLEATVVGKVTRDLKIFSGITLLDPTLRTTGNAATEGKQYVGMPKMRTNILLEYGVPWATGLVATFDWQYLARRPGNDPNTTWAPAYTVIDLGARYTTRVLGKATTWRLAVDNLTNKFYWSTIGPSNLTGAVSGNMTAHLGAPRTVAASMSVNF